MKLVGGTLIFIAALFLGIGAAAVGAVVEPYLVLPEVEIAEPERGLASMPKGVKVLYAGPGWDADHKERFLMFFIYNGGDEPLHYIGYSPEHAFPRLRANGLDLPDTYICGSGASRFTILPGRTGELHVYREEFLSRQPKNTLISVGFDLRPESVTESIPRFSEPFPLPEEFRKLIKSH